jgi:hypothetical protein
VKGSFSLLTGSAVWPPAAAPPALVAAALLFDPNAVTLYRGLKITRPGVCNMTLQCSPSFHHRPRQDAVLLCGEPDFAYDDIQAMEYGLIHCFFSYSGVGLTSLLRWGAAKFDVLGGDDDGSPSLEDVLPQYAQFFLMQRYRPSASGNALLRLRHYAAKDLSNDYETENVAVIYTRARPLSWFHGSAANDMKKKKGAIFCEFN